MIESQPPSRARSIPVDSKFSYPLLPLPAFLLLLLLLLLSFVFFNFVFLTSSCTVSILSHSQRFLSFFVCDYFVLLVIPFLAALFFEILSLSVLW
jgi:hypothetical protein